jgi:hypothetical protein
MLADRINNTLRFFDLQDFPLTAWEIHKYLISDLKILQTKINSQHELTDDNQLPVSPVHFDTILTQLHILIWEHRIVENGGFYCLPGREQIIVDRQLGYLQGIKRERLIRRYAKAAKHLPFVRSVVLLGSQALGRQKSTSDIDLLVITDPNFIGLARFFLTCYFQILGVRRHGKKIANRFCLNHYLAGPIALGSDRNLYTAYEYLKARPLVYPNLYKEFMNLNSWIYVFFPNAQQFQIDSILAKAFGAPSGLQDFLERIFQNSIGRWLEQKMTAVQLRRIQPGEFTISNHQEMSFHPDNRKQTLFESFFKSQQLHNRKTE